MVHLWKEFGLALGLKPTTLERIRSNHLKDVESCFTEALAAWLKGEDRPHDSPGPNWEEVMSALKSPSVNMRDYAHQLTQKLESESKLVWLCLTLANSSTGCITCCIMLMMQYIQCCMHGVGIRSMHGVEYHTYYVHV